MPYSSSTSPNAHEAHEAGCLAEEYEHNQAGVLFDVASAPEDVGLPCPRAECSVAFILKDSTVKYVGACLLRGAHGNATPDA